MPVSLKWKRAICMCEIFLYCFLFSLFHFTLRIAHSLLAVLCINKRTNAHTNAQTDWHVVGLIIRFHNVFHRITSMEHSASSLVVPEQKTEVSRSWFQMIF